MEIRSAIVQDAPEIAELLTLLGHPTDEVRIRSMWDEWFNDGNRALVAMGVANSIVGVITLHKMRVLHRPKAVGRITSLIVDSEPRGMGIGTKLVASAEIILTEAGCGLIEITSNYRLTEAHDFYGRCGYERTSVRLAKIIG